MPKSPQQQTKQNNKTDNLISGEITIKSNTKEKTIITETTPSAKMSQKETTPAKISSKRTKKEANVVVDNVADIAVENVAMEVVPATKEEIIVTDTLTVIAKPPSTNTEYYEQSQELQGQFQQLSNLFNTVRRNFVTLERNYNKNLRAAQKASRSSKFRRNGGFDKKGGAGGVNSGTGSDIPATPRAPSGFVKPTLISDELAAFLGKDAGKTEMARTSVTKEINQYIREHDLQDKTNGRRIIPDEKLRLLLKLPQDEELTYFNLQRFMRVHFPLSKTMAAANAAAAAAASASAAAVV